MNIKPIENSGIDLPPSPMESTIDEEPIFNRRIIMKNLIYIGVVLIGLLQIIGYVTKVDAIRSLGILSSSAPLPLVFTEVKGVETFVNDFYIHYKDETGANQELKLTPEIYKHLKGPYNRRNIYGAAIGYGPVLPESLWNSVLSYGLCNHVLNEEFNISKEVSEVSIFIKTRTAHRNDTWVLEPKCL